MSGSTGYEGDYNIKVELLRCLSIISLARQTNMNFRRAIPQVTGQTDKISNAGAPPTPNKAIRKDKGGLFLYNKAIYLDRGQNCWRYKTDNEEVPDKEFWIPQKQSRPPNHAFLHKATNTFYQKKNEVYFDNCYEHWLRKAEDKLFFVNDEHFESPYWIPGKFEENLPDDLRPYSSPAETPKASTLKLTVTSSRSGVFGANLSESELEPSDKEEADQQLPDSSDLVEHSILSPLTGLSLCYNTVQTPTL